MVLVDIPSTADNVHPGPLVSSLQHNLVFPTIAEIVFVRKPKTRTRLRNDVTDNRSRDKRIDTGSNFAQLGVSGSIAFLIVCRISFMTLHRERWFNQVNVLFTEMFCLDYISCPQRKSVTQKCVDLAAEPWTALEVQLQIR